VERSAMIQKTLTDEIGKIIQDISIRREEIKSEYIRAWIAHVVPDQNLYLDWIIENCSLQEKWSNDMKTVTWQLILKDKHEIK
jgi:hypothetical protein